MEPDVNSVYMRHGPKPLLRKYKNFEEEALYIRDSISDLLLNGYKAGQIAVLGRRNRSVEKLRQALKGLDVNIGTFHAYKGLEFEIVFLSQFQETFQEADQASDISDERRLVYMAMTRARQQLLLTYQGLIPNPIRPILNLVDSLS